MSLDSISLSLLPDSILSYIISFTTENLKYRFKSEPEYQIPVINLTSTSKYFYSKRKFLSKYFNYIISKKNLLNKNYENILISEISRSEKIVESLNKNNDNLKSLHFFCCKKIYLLPENLETLIFSHQNNEQICGNLIEVKYGCQIFTNKYPKNLKTLEYHGNNFEIDDIFSKNLIPPKLEKLILFGNWNSELKNLPKSLKSFGFDRFNSNFNKSVDNLPTNLETLKLAEFFDQKIDHLPSNLNKLFISVSFNQKIDNLPSKLTILHIDGFFNQKIDHLPSTLIELFLTSSDFNQKIDNLPSGLIKFRLLSQYFNNKLEKLPSNLKYLELDLENFNQEIDHLPKSLLKLDFCSKKFNKTVDNLPEGLLNLVFISRVPKSSMNKLPKSLISTNIKLYK